MSYREELARRLCDVPFSARQIAKQSGLSPAWVARARAGTAHKISLEAANQIHLAIDDLAAQAGAPQKPPLHHPGVEVLLSDAQLCSSYEITEEEARWLRSLWWDGEPPLQTTQDAIDELLAHRRRLARTR